MTTLNGVQILEIIGGVDDELVAESLDVFCGEAAGGVPVFAPALKRPNRAFRTVLALGLAAAMLCFVVTAVPFLGGPDLWGGFYGVIAPLLDPDVTKPPEEESRTEPTEESEPMEEEAEDGEETRKNPTVIAPDGGFSGGIVQETPTVPMPNIPSVPDPGPEWPTVNIPDPTPQRPTVPRPNVPTPGPTPWP
jgi:hypothetical protein